MNKVKLGSCVSVTRGTTLSGSFYSEKGEKIRLTLGNFDYPGGGFKENSSKKDIFFIGKVKENFILKKGDIITPLTEQVVGLLGETAKIPENDKYIQSGDIGLLKPDLTKIDPNFLYYLLPTKYVKTQLGSAAQQTKIRHTSPLKIMDCYVYLPELALQKKIGLFFSKIDKKIQNNKRQIEILESIAKTIYDYWFVQFDFPNEEGKPYKSSGGKMVWNEELKMEIPFAWKTGKLKDLFTKKTDQISSHDKGNLSYVPMDRIPIRRMSFGIGFDNKDANTSLILFDKYDVIVGAMRCYFHRVSVAPSKGITRMTSFVLRVKKDNFLSYAYETVNCDSAIDYAARMSIGTQQPYAVWENSFENYPFAMPTHDLLSKYEVKVRKIIDTVINLEKENSYLSALRKTILPLLMNGQVSLN